jgi:hypothetical protein
MNRSQHSTQLDTPMENRQDPKPKHNHEVEPVQHDEAPTPIPVAAAAPPPPPESPERPAPAPVRRSRGPVRPLAPSREANPAAPTPTPAGPERPAAESAGVEMDTEADKQAQPPLPSFKPTDFNISCFRLNETLADHAGGQKLLTTVPVRKPSRESWFRTHPDEQCRLPTPVIELKEQGETYLVARQLWPELMGEATFVAKLLVPTLTRQNDLLLWPIRLPGPDGTIDDWSASAMDASNIARTKWVRLYAKRSLGAYEVLVAPDPQSEPTWPQHPLAEIIKIAFKGRIIESLDHPVIRQLRGQA